MNRVQCYRVARAKDGRARRAKNPSGSLPDVRSRSAALLCLLVVSVDQISKAVQSAGTFIVNPGGAAIVPSALGDALWKSHTFGAACDTVATVLLSAGFRVAGRLANTRHRLAATTVLAGLVSNLVDRLGGASLFHAGMPRGAIDWIPIPPWPGVKINIADIAVVLGALGLAFQPARRALRALHAFTRSSPARLAVATTSLIVLATWSTFWQANRHAAEVRITSRSETTILPAPTGEEPPNLQDMTDLYTLKRDLWTARHR